MCPRPTSHSAQAGGQERDQARGDPHPMANDTPPTTRKATAAKPAPRAAKAAKARGGAQTKKTAAPRWRAAGKGATRPTPAAGRTATRSTPTLAGDYAERAVLVPVGVALAA